MGMSETNDPNWDAGGGSAWELVRKDLRLRRKVNDWLTDEKKLSTSYELRVRNLVTIQSIKAKLSDLASKAVSEVWEGAFEPDEEGAFGDPLGEIEEALCEVPDKLEKIETLFSDFHELVMYDRRSKTLVSHRDVGIGISQVLPVLAYSFAFEEKLFAIEQPEIHLHPALQSELADVFIESALGERRNTFLLETHSEHLLLRVMRRMRETFESTLPEGCRAVRPEDVMVLFVEPDGARSIVREMPLNERGELVKAWPGGFFEEGLREVF
jgi:predicted ATP-dependent endonuclease of OLD family